MKTIKCIYAYYIYIGIAGIKFLKAFLIIEGYGMIVTATPSVEGMAKVMAKVME